jgi:hypothetical protein
MYCEKMKRVKLKEVTNSLENASCKRKIIKRVKR